MAETAKAAPARALEEYGFAFEAYDELYQITVVLDGEADREGAVTAW